MQTYWMETVVPPNRELTVRGVPFRAGEKVQVIIIAHPRKWEKERYPLRAKPIRYVAPFDSVAEDEWQVVR
jgi:hypothetical protein